VQFCWPPWLLLVTAVNPAVVVAVPVGVEPPLGLAPAREPWPRRTRQVLAVVDQLVEQHV
jgi:hypothetical protein